MPFAVEAYVQYGRISRVLSKERYEEKRIYISRVLIRPATNH